MGVLKISKKIIFDYVVMDALNYCYKYWFIHGNLYNSKKEWTGLYYGFFNKIQKLKKEHPKSDIIIAWDRESTIRKNINETYKANRTHKTEKMINEMKTLRMMFSMYGIRQYYQNGYEADDVIAKLCQIYKDKKLLICSSDKDLFQLLSDNVFIARKKNAKSPEAIYSKEEIEESFNIVVDNYTLYKAMVGDAGDNVKGVERINKFETKKFVNFIDGDIGRIYSIKNMLKFRKIKNKVVMNFGKIEENYELVKLYTDFELKEIDIIKDREKLIKKLKRFELKQALKNLLED